MLPVLHIGPLALPTTGLVLIIGLWLALSIPERQAAKRGLAPDQMYRLTFTGLLAGIVGARLLYVFRFPGVFLADPLAILSLNAGLLDVWGGVVAGGLAAGFYGWRKGLALWPTLDALTPPFAIVAVAIGVAHFTSGDAFGAPSSAPWAIELWGARRHPSQVYEIIAAGAILLAIWPWSKSKAMNMPGVSFLTFTALTAGARLFLETFRGDSVLLPMGLRSAQVTAWLVLGLSLWLLGKRAKEQVSK